ncbi:MAG: homoserine kinase [Rhizobiaceae bacterium]
MAVYTEVSDKALTQFLKRYDLGTVLSLKGIAGGVENTNYLLHMSTGSYILTLYEKRVETKDLPFFIGLMDHLATQGFQCPLPMRDRNGEALGTLAGRPAAMTSFLEGMEVKQQNAGHCQMAGEAMARLHLAAGDYKTERENALAPHGWPVLVEASLPRADTVEEGMANLISGELDHAQHHWPKRIPAGVIHADMFKDNVFFLEGELSGVIDFYFACNDFLAYDIAIGINAWCFDENFNFQPKFCAAFLAGYQSVRELEKGEVDALPTLARGAALRFLLTRLNDWLNVPAGALVTPHDPKAFSKRLRFLQTVGDAKEFGLI